MSWGKWIKHRYVPCFREHVLAETRHNTDVLGFDVEILEGLQMRVEFSLVDTSSELYVNMLAGYPFIEATLNLAIQSSQSKNTPSEG